MFDTELPHRHNEHGVLQCVLCNWTTREGRAYEAHYAQHDIKYRSVVEVLIEYGFPEIADMICEDVRGNSRVMTA